MVLTAAREDLLRAKMLLTAARGKLKRVNRAPFGASERSARGVELPRDWPRIRAVVAGVRGTDEENLARTLGENAGLAMLDGGGRGLLALNLAIWSI
jgi:hypothetical protein